MNLHYTTQFKKDYKKIKKQNKDLSKLKTVIEALFERKPLDPKFKDHLSYLAIGKAIEIVTLNRTGY